MPAPTNLLSTASSVLDNAGILCSDVGVCKPHTPTDSPSISPPLDALHPMPVVPYRMAQRRSQAVDALKRVEFLEVSKSKDRRDRTVYSVRVYHHDTHSRIPVHGHFGRQRQSIVDRKRIYPEPSMTVQLAFDDFLQLRYDAYELARSSHLLDTCAFCDHVIFLNSSSAVKPRWHSHWFKSDDEECRLLTAYLTEMLALVAQIPAIGGDQCRGHQRIPRLLQIFLRSYELERHSF